MRPSNKSRSRNKNNNNNRRQNLGNVINRVFDSSGPEGRVRGTPQQIIDKYQSLASDAMLAGDRIAHENFLQHSEHYSRLLVVAQKELDAKREQQQKQNENKPPVSNAEKVYHLKLMKINKLMFQKMLHNKKIKYDSLRKKS